jgi:hypothetical protein
MDRSRPEYDVLQGLLGDTPVREHVERVLFMQGFDGEGNLAGIWLRHTIGEPEVAPAGRTLESHAPWIPSSAIDRRTPIEQLTLYHDIECPCGLRGRVREGRWIPL